MGHSIGLKKVVIEIMMLFGVLLRKYGEEASWQVTPILPTLIGFPSVKTF